MNPDYQEVFIVLCERKHEPETQRVVAVFDTQELADSYLAKQRSSSAYQGYAFFMVEDVLRTELP
jgi:hypothetical protein